MIKRNKLLAFLIAVFHYTAYGQGGDPIAPWITSQLGNINVAGGNLLQPSHAQGTANITIPFYSYSISGVDLGVSMSYNTQAHQVDRAASNLGLGWELNCGGLIEREIRDFPDDVYLNNTNACSHTDSKEGYWHRPTNPPNILTADNEPDVFYLVLGNRTIKFMIGRDWSLITIPQTDIKVEPLIDGQAFYTSILQNQGATTGFKVTDEAGNKFYFERFYRREDKYVADRLWYPISCASSYFPIVKWMLVKVETYEGEVIDYEYERATVDFKEPVSQGVRILEANVYWYTPTTSQRGTNAEITRLKKIKYPNNIDVIFTYDDLYRCDVFDKRLVKIEVKERTSSSHVLKYTFDHSYFLSPARSVGISTSYNNTASISSNCIHPNDKRLKLDKVNFAINNNTPRLLYDFGYSNMPLPSRLTGNRDMFGHANEHPVQYFTCPDVSSLSLELYITYLYGSSGILGLNRSVSTADYTAACMLKKITNGHGGQLQWTYINNQYGSLMIDEIMAFDGYNHDNDVITKYTYDDVDWTPTSLLNYNLYMETSSGAWLTYKNAISNTALLSEGLNGPRVIFRTVTEEVKNRTGSPVKKIVYNFSGSTVHPEINDGPTTGDDNDLKYGTNYDQPPYSNKQYRRDWGKGLPLSISHYVYHNNNIQLLKKESFKYTVTENHQYQGNVNFKCIAKLVSHINKFNENHDWYEDTYYPYTGRTQLIEKKVEEYYGANSSPIVSLTNFYYDSKGNIQKQTSSNSTNQLLEQRFYYSYDFTGSGVTTINALNTAKVQKLLFTESWKNNTLRGVAVTGLTTIPSTTRVRPNHSYTLASSVPLTSGGLTTDLSGICNGNTVSNMRRVQTITKYHSKGYPLETVDGSGTSYSSTIWDTYTGIELAKVVNATHDEVAYTGFESEYSLGADKGNWHIGTDIETSSSNVFLGRRSYWLKNTGSLSTNCSLVADKEYFLSFWLKGKQDGLFGVNTCSSSAISLVGKEIDSCNGWYLYKVRFKVTSNCTPGPNGIGFWTSDTNGRYMDELRVYPVDAQMTSVNITPLLGKTSDVDANERFTLYEYDAYGNLHITRDHKLNIIQKVEHKVQQAD